jgi:hypothetical protein
MSLDQEKGYAPLLWVELGRNGQFVKGRIYSFVQSPPGGPKRDEKERAWALMKKLSQEDFPETSPLFDESGIILPREKVREENLVPDTPSTVHAPDQNR